MLALIRAAKRAGGGGRAGIALLSTLSLVLLSCNNPQAPAPAGDPAYSGRYDREHGALHFLLQSPGGGTTPLQLVATELQYDATTQELHAQVAIQNTGSATLPGPDAVALSGFDPPEVWPGNAICLRDPARNVPGGCFFEYRGTYGNDGQLGPGETSSAVEWILHDPSGESFAFDARLVYRPQSASGVIAGTVFEDHDANGHRDPSEPGIAGTEVTMRHGGTTAATASDSSGQYEFAVPEPGLYELSAVGPAGSTPTTPSRLQVLIVRRPDGSLSAFTHADFGYARPDTTPGLVVEGVVFADLNRDGHRDPSEPGVPGIAIQGSTGCPTFAPIVTHTDPGGHYVLKLPRCPGPILVHRLPLPGTVDTTPNPVQFDSPPAPGDVLHADFGMAREGTGNDLLFEGFVFKDANGNGHRDVNEPGIPGVGVSASGLCMTPISAFTRTDDQGHYALKGADVHCPLPWWVTHEPLPNTFDTSPNPAQLRQPPPDGVFHVDFGIAPGDTIPPPPPLPILIEGTVFEDANSNGVRDRGEHGFPDVELQIVSACDVFIATRTDSLGHYRFVVPGLCPLAAVLQSLPEFPVHTTPNPAPIDPSPPPGSTLKIDFGVHSTAGAPHAR